MDAIHVKCPCCKASLTVSTESGQVLHFEELKRGPADFGNFLDKQKNRSEELTRKFEQAKEKSQSRLQTINEKVEWKKQHLDERPAD
ncbi:MAG: hypothetical protein A2293_04570 [Elusimicrobia bacterium RIFOXYB2_FULL_49_7]|nr:MAG: hypothetical protein A2293_04570 [Elusimicrobia bacterium RIFOXYB2_FULL_49_7]